MADITKCTGLKVQEVCPLRFDCYRYMAPTDPYRQSWMEAPFKRDQWMTRCGMLLSMHRPPSPQEPKP